MLTTAILENVILVCRTIGDPSGSVFTVRCTIVQSAVLIACHPSVCNISGSGSHRLEILETNCTDN